MSLTLSYSGMNTYRQCGQKYYWQYVEGWKMKVPSENLIFGTMVHAGVAMLGNGASIGTMQQAIKDWDVSDYKNNAALRMKTIETVLELWNKIKDIPTVLTSKGEPFVEQKLEAITHGVTVVGVIDRVQIEDGIVQLVDFKTSKSDYGTHMVKLSDQLGVYQWLLEKNGCPVDKISYLVANKTNGNIDWHTRNKFSQAELNLILDKVRHTHTQIKHGIFFKDPGYQCNWCDFLSLCLGKPSTKLIKSGETPIEEEF